MTDGCPLSNEQLAAQLRDIFPRLPNSPITDAQRQLIHVACDRLERFDREWVEPQRLTLGRSLHGSTRPQRNRRQPVVIDEVEI